MVNITNLIRKNIALLEPYSSARDEYKSGKQSNLIFVDANENPFNNGVNRYPDPQQTKLKSYLAKTKGVSTENILLGNGSDEVLDLLIRAFCEPNKDKIIILPPTYGMYGVLANINSVFVTKIPLTNNFEPNVKAILDNSQNSKILFLCSPNNPTGNSFKTDTILNLISNFNGIVVIDEAYIDFSENESLIGFINKYPNLVVIQTLSKAHGMAGIRLGVCYASNQIIAVLNKIKPPYNINTLTQNFALKQLQNSTAITQQIKIIKTERSWLGKALNTISFIEKVYPSQANFLLVKVDNAKKRYQQLIQQNIVVRDRSNEVNCDNCLRITIGTPEENKRLLTTLKKLQ